MLLNARLLPVSDHAHNTLDSRVCTSTLLRRHMSQKYVSTYSTYVQL